MKLSRRIKKELKKRILIGKDTAWNLNDVKITSVVRCIRRAKTNPTYKGLTVNGYMLG
jgi:hypothetical protein